jgi:flagellar assembly protein FliH
VCLRMHPHDLAALGDQIERVVAQISRVGNVEVLADATIERGGCRVETRFGSIDQQFAAQLERIEEELR